MSEQPSVTLLILNKVSYLTFGYLPLTVQYLRDLRDTMPRHWSLSASDPNQGSGEFTYS